MTLYGRIEVTMSVAYRRARCVNCKSLYRAIQQAGGEESAPDCEFEIAAGHLVRVHNLGDLLAPASLVKETAA